MSELPAFEGRLAAGLETLAGPRRIVDANGITRAAVSRAPVRRSIAGQRRPARSLLVLLAATLIIILAIGAVVVGSDLVRRSVIAPTPSPEARTPEPSLAIRPPSAAVWTATGSMNEGRYQQTATQLLDGEVLVAGGSNDSSGSSRLASAELYDPVTRSWSVTGSMIEEREWHSATLLPDGTVLVAGGVGRDGESASAELYDPATGSWTATGRMTETRFAHTATLLGDGRVLVAGGFRGSGRGQLASTEIYDPATGSWTATGSMIKARALHTATLLPDGRVLVAGGVGRDGAEDSAELYDPTTGTWAATGRMNTGRQEHSATLLRDGTVLVAGGARPGGTVTGGVEASAELYDPATGSWTATGSMLEERAIHTATLLLDGTVLVAGGSGLAGQSTSAELYQPTSGTWEAGGSMSPGRTGHSATLLDDGRVLIAGGRSDSGSFNASAELYVPGSGN